MQSMKNLGIFYVENMTMLIENDGSGNPLYVGYAKPGNLANGALPVWRIMKVDYTTGFVTAVSYADGDDEMNNIRNDRLGLSYS